MSLKTGRLGSCDGHDIEQTVGSMRARRKPQIRARRSEVHDFHEQIIAGDISIVELHPACDDRWVVEPLFQYGKGCVDACIATIEAIHVACDARIDLRNSLRQEAHADTLEKCTPTPRTVGDPDVERLHIAIVPVHDELIDRHIAYTEPSGDVVRGSEREHRHERIASANRADNLADRTITAGGDDQVRLVVEGRLPASLRPVVGDIVTDPCNQLDELIFAMIVIPRLRIVDQKHTHLPQGCNFGTGTTIGTRIRVTNVRMSGSRNTSASVPTPRAVTSSEVTGVPRLH